MANWAGIFPETIIKSEQSSHMVENLICNCPFIFSNFSFEMSKELFIQNQLNFREPLFKRVKCEFDIRRLKLSDQAHPNDDK